MVFRSSLVGRYSLVYRKPFAVPSAQGCAGGGVVVTEFGFSPGVLVGGGHGAQEIGVPISCVDYSCRYHVRTVSRRAASF